MHDIIEGFFRNWEYTMTFLSLVVAVLGLIIAIIIFWKQNKAIFNRDCSCIIAIIDDIDEVCIRLENNIKVLDKIEELHLQIVNETDDDRIINIFYAAKERLSDFKENIIRYPVSSYEKFESRLFENMGKRIKLYNRKRKMSISQLATNVKIIHNEIENLSNSQNNILRIIPNNKVFPVSSKETKKTSINADEVKQVFNSVSILLNGYRTIAISIEDHYRNLLETA